MRERGAMELSRRSIGGSSASSLQGGESPPARSSHVRQISSLSSYNAGGRPPSVQGSLRPSTSRSMRSLCPGTPGLSLGITPEVKVESRPLTQQGLMTSRSNYQGPGRQVQDKSYFCNKLRTRKQELQAEIESMNEELEKLRKQESANALLEQKQKALNEEVLALKAQLGDYNATMEKVTSGVELDELKEQLRALTEKNEATKERVDRLCGEHIRKEQSYKEAEEKIKFLESEMERRVHEEAPELEDQYIELRNDARTLVAEAENLELELQDITVSAQSLEQELESASPEKKRAAVLMEQLLNAEAEVSKLKAEEPPTVKLSPEEARRAMLQKIRSSVPRGKQAIKIRQDNAELAKAEEKIKEVEAEVKEYEEKIVEANKTLAELKGGRAEKFLEMQQKEKKMQAFIDNYDAMKREHEETARLTKQRIEELQKEQASRKEGNGESQESANDIDDLIVVEERQQELNQLMGAEERSLKELADSESRIATLKAEIAKVSNLDDLRTQWESKCSKLEEQKLSVEEDKKRVQVELDERKTELQSLQRVLDGNEMLAKREELKQKLSNLQQTTTKLQEEVDLKERENNCKPVLENIRFMVGQLNTEIIAQNAR